MIWAALLLSVSSYSWYLIFAFNPSVGYPGSEIGLALLALLAIIPALWSYATNRNLLVSNPMVLRVVGVNLIQYLVYAGLVALGGIISNTYVLAASREMLSWKVYLLPFTWQLISWLIGMYYALNSGALADHRPSNIRAAEISLLMIIPAVFILTFQGFPVWLLVMIIACWFLALNLTLAVEGRDTNAASIFRYELVFLHALIPAIAAIILFIIAFFGEIRDLFLTAQQGIIALWNLIVTLLNLLFSKPPEVDINSYDFPAFYAKPEREPEVAAQVSPLWFIIPLLILAIPPLLALINGLIKLLRMRLGSQQTFTAKRHIFIGSLFQVWKYLFLLVGHLFKQILKLIALMKDMGERLLKKITQLIKIWLPPRTPYHRVYRSYEAFLRWSRKSGFPQKPGETPLEYARRLEKSIPTHSHPYEEINQLTNIFLEAQYSNKPVSRQQGDKSRVLLKKIRAR